MYITLGHDKNLIRCFDLDLILKVTAGKKTVKLRPKMLKFKISSCRGSEFTPESNLTYLSSQYNFSLMPYCSMNHKNAKKHYVCYVKCIVSMATNNSIHEWGCYYKSNYISAATKAKLLNLVPD